MKFNERLKEFRENLKIKTKRDMAKKLDISEQLYYMLESGTREPSKDILSKLYLISEKPEEYWLYGIDIENEYINMRAEFKSSNDAIEQLYNLGLLTETNCTEGAKEMLLAAILVDAKHIILKKKEGSK